MLQNIVYFLRGSNQNQEETTAADGVETTHNTRLTSVVSEDDWVLVDRDSEGNSEVSSDESFEIDGDDDDCHTDSNLPFQKNLSRTSSSSSLPCTSNMEESWFLTPPPSFTSAGPIHMETSPLENLLIEHPSMSVYQHTHLHHNNHRRHNAPVANNSPAFVDLDELDVEEIVEVGEAVAVVVQRPTRNNRVQVLQQQERQCLKNKKAQKVQVQKACESLKRGYLERINKAREVNSRNRRQRRGERSQGAQRSYANNNRKC